jgi:hypothetical protein
MGAKDVDQRQFRLLVPATPNPRHHLRPFLLGEDVGADRTI